MGSRKPGELIAWITLVIVFTITIVVVTKDHNKTIKLAKANTVAIIRLNAAVKHLHHTDVLLKKNKANVDQLRKSNCTLRLFLATARKRVYNQTLAESGIKLTSDSAAITGYTNLIEALDGKAYCPIPQKLLLPQKLVEK